jgi:hypothetical protein
MWLPSWRPSTASGSTDLAGHAVSSSREFDGVAAAPEPVMSVVDAMTLGERLPAFDCSEARQRSSCCCSAFGTGGLQP